MRQGGEENLGKVVSEEIPYVGKAERTTVTSVADAIVKVNICTGAGWCLPRRLNEDGDFAAPVVLRVGGHLTVIGGLCDL
jgi:hypothetical protein